MENEKLVKTEQIKIFAQLTSLYQNDINIEVKNLFGVGETGRIYKIETRTTKETDSYYSLGRDKTKNLFSGSFVSLKEFNFNFQELYKPKNISLAVLVKNLDEWEDPHVIYLFNRPNMRKVFLSLDKLCESINNNIQLSKEECIYLSNAGEDEISGFIDEESDEDSNDNEKLLLFYRIYHIEVKTNRLKVYFSS